MNPSLKIIKNNKERIGILATPCLLSLPFVPNPRHSGKIMEISKLNGLDILKITISGPKNDEGKYKKISGRKIISVGREFYQFEMLSGNQIFHKNVEKSELYDYITESMSIYNQADIVCADSNYMIFNKKSELSLVKVKGSGTAEISPHNRIKRHILNEGDEIPVFIELGIFTSDYKIVNTMYKKFKQINRFIELFDDAVSERYGSKTPDKTLEIVDFGCGKSYLTFILFYYLVKIKNFKIRLTGLDLKEDVIKNCNTLAKKYGYDNDGLSFSVGDINGYKQSDSEFSADIVVSLHGCDTATDYALFNAIKWNCDIIFVAPCCEHEMSKSALIEPLENMLRHGIIKERFFALATSAVRCDILEISGYKTEILEFVDISHSPKNLLIRAVKAKHTRTYTDKIKYDLDAMKRSFGFDQTLYSLVFGGEV